MKSVTGKIIFNVILLSLPLWLFCQDYDVVPAMGSILPIDGYVILSDGDTLFGKITWKLKYVENNPVEIKFTSETGVTKSFNAGEVIGFGNQPKVYQEDNPIPLLAPYEHYLTMPSYKKGEPVFLHRLLGGRITIFQNRSSPFTTTSWLGENAVIDGKGFFFSFENGLSIGTSYRTETRVIKYRARFRSYYVSKDGNPIIKVEKENYEAIYKILFGDCPAIDEELALNPDLSRYRNFMLLAEIYNQLCSGQ